MNQSELLALGYQIDAMSVEADHLCRELERLARRCGVQSVRPSTTTLESLARRVVALMFEERGEFDDLKNAVAEMAAFLKKGQHGFQPSD